MKKRPEQDESDGVNALLCWAIIRTFKTHKNDKGLTVGISKWLFSFVCLFLQQPIVDFSRAG